jgi:hypothetical protein
MNRSAIKVLRRAGLVLILLLSVSVYLQAATVRGRLVRNSPQGQFPAAGIAVTVWCEQLGRSAASYSLRDGMYYIPNVPAGYYQIEVWIGPQNALRFPIQVSEPNSDIPPIIVP